MLKHCMKHKLHMSIVQLNLIVKKVQCSTLNRHIDSELVQ